MSTFIRMFRIYSSRKQPRDTLNSDDSIATEATSASYAKLKEERGHYLVSMIIGASPTMLTEWDGRRVLHLPGDRGPAWINKQHVAGWVGRYRSKDKDQTTLAEARVNYPSITAMAITRMGLSENTE